MEEREQKGEKGEHLVCRALISVALGERVLPTFPHKHTCTHAVTPTCVCTLMHTRTLTHIHSLTLAYTVMVGC